MNEKQALLKISNLSVTFNKIKPLCALSDFSCTLYSGRCTAVIGESGSGKSVAAHAILKLLPEYTTITGTVHFGNLELISLSEDSLQEIRGKKIGLIYQSPDRSLNPIFPIGRQMRKPLDAHNVGPVSERLTHIKKTLRKVGFSNPDTAMVRYPCHCSGGMNQRAATAVVLGLLPEIVIADEPTKGLDRDRALDVETSLNDVTKTGQSLLLITHDIPLAERIADELIVIYAGQIVEKGPVNTVLCHPLHPYTKGLINSLPRNGFIPIDGNSPSLSNIPPGCRFANRCEHSSDFCIHNSPNLKIIEKQEVRCHLY